MNESPPKLVTVGTIAAEVGIPVDRVLRILRTRKHIKHRALAGHIRLFDNEAVAQVRYVVQLQDARRSGRREVGHVD